MCCSLCVFKVCQTNSKVSREKINTDGHSSTVGPRCFFSTSLISAENTAHCANWHDHFGISPILFRGIQNGWIFYSPCFRNASQGEERWRRWRGGSAPLRGEKASSSEPEVDPIKNTCPTDNPTAEPIRAACVASAGTAATFTATVLMLRILKYPVYGLT